MGRLEMGIGDKDVNTELAAGIHWVGHVDWTVRDFHGYVTNRGSTYNAYLVQDEHTAVIDAVKAPYVDSLIRQVGERVAPETVRYVVCNHAEPDHSGGLPEVLKAFPKAELICDAKCRVTLQKHYGAGGWPFRVVADGETLGLGKRSLRFFETPMVHWPESMFTYVPEDGVLFSMDAFGQHYASAHRFDDEEPLDVVMAEAKTYYANILMLYGKPIASVLERAAGLRIDLIAPSHGVIWRRHIPAIVEAYKGWVVCKPSAKVVVMYDTMWKSTELMARAIVQGAMERNVDVRLHHVRETSLTELATETLDAAALAIGSPTLNMTLMPQVAAVLAYLKGLRPTGKAAFAFGSYGWGKGAAKEIEDSLRGMKWDILREPLQCQFVPDEEMQEACRAAGRMLADRALSATAG